MKKFKQYLNEAKELATIPANRLPGDLKKEAKDMMKDLDDDQFVVYSKKKAVVSIADTEEEEFLIKDGDWKKVV